VPALLQRIGAHCRALAHDVSGLSLVLDKGNSCRENLTEVAATQLHFVGALVPTQHAHLHSDTTSLDKLSGDW
jgi:hypothetical protein